MSKAMESRKKRSSSKKTLEEVLEFVQIIQDKNNGKPMKKIHIADHLKIDRESPNLKNLINASSKYGLTQVSAKSDTISLTRFGESVVKAKGAERTSLLRQVGVMSYSSPIKRPTKRPIIRP
jgi:hypothetical protein